MFCVQPHAHPYTQLQECLRYGSVGSTIIEEKPYPRQYQNKFRKAASQVEVASGCKMAVQAVQNGNTVVQYYGLKVTGQGSGCPGVELVFGVVHMLY